MYQKYIKRMLDFILSLILILLLWPLLIIIALFVRFNVGSPIIFKQKRPGLNEKIFTLYKFRTMTNSCDKNGNLLTDDKRLTKFGKFLRSTSLDELPELINILKGEMSFVGPRPLLVIDMLFMTKNERLRHYIRPGLTGLAQVMGRNGITWEKKLSYDLKYLENITFFNDVKIIMKTFLVVIKKDGIAMNVDDTSLDLGDYLLNNRKITRDKYDKMIKKSLSYLK